MSHFHSHSTPVRTEGILIRWVQNYDLLTNLLTLGQAGRLRKKTIEVSLLKPGESLLDVGCGTGGVTIPGKLRVGPGGIAAGIDPSPEMIAVSQQKAKRKGLEIDFRVGVIEALPFPDASFDVVTASLMVHHLPSDDLQRRGFAEIHRVLKPGGRLLIADLIGPRSSFSLAMILHHRKELDSAKWIRTLEQVGFCEATHLDQHFSMIGFIRAVK
jgi:demethylmenaquinone methyltransferase/2-methoxy-6-polyprenyl-1,4-benzoquinol methylase/phosphoethanolamine N-methyltransferase